MLSALQFFFLQIPFEGPQKNAGAYNKRSRNITASWPLHCTMNNFGSKKWFLNMQCFDLALNKFAFADTISIFILFEGCLYVLQLFKWPLLELKMFTVDCL